MKVKVVTKRIELLGIVSIPGQSDQRCYGAEPLENKGSAVLVYDETMFSPIAFQLEGRLKAIVFRHIGMDMSPARLTQMTGQINNLLDNEYASGRLFTERTLPLSGYDPSECIRLPGMDPELFSQYDSSTVG